MGDWRGGWDSVEGEKPQQRDRKEVRGPWASHRKVHMLKHCFRSVAHGATVRMASSYLSCTMSSLGASAWGRRWIPAL